jgi:hypothetical protein
MRHIKKIVISFCYCSKYISTIKKKPKEKSKKKTVQKEVYWILPQKIKQEKLDQLNSELDQILYSDYWVPNRTIYKIWDQLDIVCFGFQIRV